MDGVKETVDEAAATITDVVFDMGGVLVDSQPWKALEGQYPQGVIDMVFDPRDPWGFEFFDAMANRGWSRDRVLREYERHHGPAVAWVYRVYLERMRYSMPAMVPGMGSVLRQLQGRGYGICGLANATTRWVAMARELFPNLRLLRDIVISSEEGVCKPDPAIFCRAIGRFGVDPASTLFVDGAERDVRAARRLGLQGEPFRGVERLRTRLGLPTTG